MTTEHPCFFCAGSGKRSATFVGLVNCDKCAGTGKSTKKIVKCTRCNGEGFRGLFKIECGACRGSGFVEVK